MIPNKFTTEELQAEINRRKDFELREKSIEIHALKQQALTEINEKIEQAQRLIEEAQKIADKAGVGFSWDGPGYGMGGYYTPEKGPNRWLEEWEESDEGGWASSSTSC